jgi:hypothetical protein
MNRGATDEFNQHIVGGDPNGSAQVRVAIEEAAVRLSEQVRHSTVPRLWAMLQTFRIGWKQGFRALRLHHRTRPVFGEKSPGLPHQPKRWNRLALTCKHAEQWFVHKG